MKTGGEGGSPLKKNYDPLHVVCSYLPFYVMKRSKKRQKPVFCVRQTLGDSHFPPFSRPVLLQSMDICSSFENLKECPSAEVKRVKKWGKIVITQRQTENSALITVM